MDWLQVLTIVGATVGSCVYFRKETKEQIDGLSKETKEQIGELRSEWKQWRTSHDAEMKDFHGRLCKLEERYIQMMQRFMSQQDRK